MLNIAKKKVMLVESGGTNKNLILYIISPEYIIFLGAIYGTIVRLRMCEPSSKMNTFINTSAYYLEYFLSWNICALCTYISFIFIPMLIITCIYYMCMYEHTMCI